MIPPLEFKFLQEVGWTIAIAVVVTLAWAAMTFDPAAVTDWTVWFAGVGGNIVRAVGTAIISSLRRGGVEIPPAPTP